MMILDKTSLLYDNTAITGNTWGSDIIDLGSGLVRDISGGNDVPLLIQVTEAFNNATTLQMIMQWSDAANFSTQNTIFDRTYANSLLVPGFRFGIDKVPVGTRGRYLRIGFFITGTPTTGRITAGVVAGWPTNG